MRVATQMTTAMRNTTQRSLLNTALTATSLLALCSPALADNWTDHVASEGSISIDTAIPNTTNITQHTDLVKVHGDGDINAGWTVNVAQPSSQSKYILYDVENDPTYILGTLNANGQIYIFDKNGVIFGRDSVVDVGSIVASTGYISDANIAADKMVFEGVGGPDAGEINLQGTINVANAGLAAFVAPTVKNSGVINATVGRVVMASGEKVTLDFYGDKLVQIAAEDALENALIENTGVINAAGGTVVMSAQAAANAVDNVINMAGVVDVSSVSVRGGKIILGGGNKGVVKVAGTANASGAQGGDIRVTGETVILEDTSILSADGTNGQGGTIGLYGSKYAVMGGAASARATNGGKGGFIELSAGNAVGFFGFADTSSEGGETGTFLIDPANINIGNYNPLVTTAQIIADIFTGGTIVDLVIDQQALANSLRTTNINLWATETINTTANLNLSLGYGGILSGCFTGCITANDLSLSAPTVNILHDITLGTGRLLVRDLPAGTSPLGLGLMPAPFNITVNELNLDGKIYTRATKAAPSFTTLATDAKIHTTANTINVLSNKALIQQAVHFADAADAATITVSDGVYNENVSIDRSLTLVSENGRDATTIRGIAGTSSEATVQIENNTNNVQLGDIGKGFTIVGFDNGNPASENAAIYLRGNHDNIDIIGNDVVAKGDLGLLSNYAGVMSNITIDNNIFSGQTFTGTPALGDQFTVNNVPRPLVFFGNAGAKSNIVFTNNNITGIAGGMNGGTPSGNLLVNIDATGATITGNIFNGTTTGTQGSLRVRGTNTFVSGNTFHAAGLGDNGYHVYANAGSYGGGQTGIMDIWNDNTFVGRATVTDSDVLPGFDFIGLTIQGAVNASTATGANIYVNGGATYNESVNVNKSVYLHGANAGKAGYDATRGAESIVDPNSPGFYVTANNVTIDGFEITGATGADGHGVSVNGASNVSVKNNRIHDVTQNGVYALNAGSVDILNNVVYNTGSHGIRLKGSNDSIINGNLIGYTATLTPGAVDNINGDGIRLETSNDASIKGNTITETNRTGSQIGSGINLISSNRATIGGALPGEGNTISNTEWDGIRVETSNRVVVEGNSTTGSERVGIYSEASTNLTIKGNNVSNTSFGGTSGATQTGAIQANKGSSVTIVDNFTNDSGAGIKLTDVAGTNIIARNTVNKTKLDGIFASGTNDVSIYDNFIGYGLDGAFGGDADSLIGGIGINIKDVKSGVVSGNKIAHTGGQGIYLNNVNADGGPLFEVFLNYIDDTAKDAVSAFKGTLLYVRNNYIGTRGGLNNIKGDGVYFDQSTFGAIYFNRITNIFSPTNDKGSGIHLNNGNVFGQAGSNDAEIYGNVISNTGWDGIRIEGSNRVVMVANDIDDVTRTGIYAENSNFLRIQNNDIDTTGHDGIRFHSVKNSSILMNRIGLAGAIGTGPDANNRHGIRFSSAGGAFNDQIVVQGNEINGAIGNGISMEHGNNITIGGVLPGQGNTITNSGLSGIEIRRGDRVTISNNILTQTGARLGTGIGILANGNASGSQNQNIVLLSNIVSDFDTGMEFRAGIIDLTGAANTINNGTTGMRFDLYPRAGTVLRLVENDAVGTSTPFDGVTPPITTPADFAGTIGTTIFNGQADNYVVLANGAFWNTATNVPFWINGRDASYDGFVPNTVVGPLTQAQYDALDAMFVDYVNTGLDGIFFFGALPGQTVSIDQSDLFNRFAGFNGDATGLNIRILGLPSTGFGGGGANFNAITPFAGGPPAPASINTAEALNQIETAAGGNTQTDGGQPAANTSAQDLSEIETAAGGESTACWGDAMTAAGSGQAVNVVYGGSFADTLSVAACGTEF